MSKQTFVIDVVDFGSTLTVFDADELRDCILDGLGYPVDIENNPERLQVREITPVEEPSTANADAGSAKS